MVCAKNIEGFELTANSVKFNSARWLPEMNTKLSSRTEAHGLRKGRHFLVLHLVLSGSDKEGLLLKQ